MCDLQEIIGGRVARGDASRLLRSSFEDLKNEEHVVSPTRQTEAKSGSNAIP
jgi:hypothetical protein